MTSLAEHTPFLRKFTAFFDRSLLRDHPVLKCAIAIAVLGLITLMFPRGESVEYSYTVGGVWAEHDLVAPFSFPILRDPRLYEKERQEAAKEVYPVFRREEKVEQTQAESLAIIMRDILTALARRGRSMRATSGNDSSWRQMDPLAITARQWQALARLRDNEPRSSQNGFAGFSQLLSSNLTDILQTGIIDRPKGRHVRGAIALRKGSTETIIPSERIYDYDSALATLEKNFDRALANEDLLELAMKIVRTVIRTNLVFDADETARAIQTAEDNVPRTSGFVRERETVISKNEIITADTKARLESLQKARQDRGVESQEWRHWLGISLHVLLVLGLFTLYLYLFRKRIFHDNPKLTIVALIILMEMFFTYLSVYLPINEPIQYLIFVPAGSMLLAIIFDSRVAFYGTVTISLLVAAMRGNDYAIGLISLIGGSLGAYTVRDIRHRTQIFRSLVFIFLGYALSILALAIERFESVSTILYDLTFAFANAVISPVLTYGLLMFFERVFNVTTDLRLVGLSDLNHPLLEELSEKAPGTFHHSLTIGNLAEAGAEAIGANAILAKVGAFYHDIGKLLKPEYFVENQVIGHNRHNRLKPRMSALIISSHVKEGIELGREHGLPEQIIDFIPQHHGTNRISFFYDKAIRQAAKRPSKETINEEDFRYPGPKPQSKETGIVMLADSVEASTRAMEEMTPQGLERAIDNMIKHRFLEGQLDECELTLRDLTNIKEAFLKILVGIHHQRIKYPEQEAAEPAPVIVVQDKAVPQPTPPAAAPEVGISGTEIQGMTTPPPNGSDQEVKPADPAAPGQPQTGEQV